MSTTDVIYFDFAKAFDIILHKLKHQFHIDIDGKLLKFLVNYLKDRTQFDIIGGKQL